MIWTISLIISLVILIGCVLWSVIFLLKPYKRDRALAPRRVLFVGTAVAAVILFLPIELEIAKKEAAPSTFNSILGAVQHAKGA